MAALGFLFADKVESVEATAILGEALGISVTHISLYSPDEMTDSPVVVEMVARGPDFKTDVSVYGRHERIQKLTDLELATMVNRASRKTVLCSAPGRSEPFWILIEPDGSQSLVRVTIEGDRIVLQETVSNLVSAKSSK